MNSADPMIEIFTFETNQQLTQLEDILIDVEEKGTFTKEEIDEVFRIMHTIKGSSAMMDFTSISGLAHYAEDLFNIIRNDESTSIDFAIVADLVLQSTDFFKDEIVKIQSGQDVDGDNSELVETINTYISQLNDEPVEETVEEPVVQEEEVVEDVTEGVEAEPVYEEVSEPVASDAPGVLNAFQINVHFDPEAKMENMRAFTLVNNLTKKVTSISHTPEDIEDNASVDYIKENGFEVFVMTEKSKEEINKVLEKTLFVTSYELTDLNSAEEPVVFVEEDTVSEVPEEVVDATEKVFKLKVQFDPEAKMENMRAFTLINNLQKTALQVTHVPSDLEDNTSAEKIRNDGFEVTIKTTETEDDLLKTLERTLFLLSYDLYEAGDEVSEAPVVAEKVEVVEEKAPVKEEVKQEVKKEVKKTEEKKPKKKDKKAKSDVDDAAFKNVNQSVISVNILKLDKVMDLIGEISVMQSVIINRETTGVKNEEEANGSEIYNNVTRQLTKLTNELRDTVMGIRLLPVSIIFNNVKRIIRDMKRQLGKDVNFEVHGEDTVLDKKIIDNLFDPLIHIVRNSMDHGIEAAEDRIAAGKDPVGNLKITAESSGGYVVISVIDDGKGIDKDKVIEKAERLGTLTKPVDTMTDSEILSLIFESGLSTKQEVSSFSGRGVGMDIVRSKVEEMSGNIFVASEVGKGTTMTIKVPLTLAILEGVKIQLGDANFIIPSKMIEKTFKVESMDNIIYDNNNNEMVMLDGNIFPIVKLSEYLEVPSGIDDFSEGIMVLVKENQQSICLFVDVILGEIESIIKPLPKYLLKYGVKENGISGCTKLENGDLCLILDVSRIISSVL
jgi:two-component system chemotaxis sensor kinase CheA